MSTSLDTEVAEFFDSEVRLSTSDLDARQLREFADAQMPRTGIGAVPWSTPLSSDQLAELAENDKATFVTARMMLASVQESPLIGIGALIRDRDIYPNPRMIIVVESEFRGQGLGIRIARELLDRLNPGEAVEVEVQQESAASRKITRFFERLGFRCVKENHRTGNVPEYVGGVPVGTVQRSFNLYAYTRGIED